MSHLRVLFCLCVVQKARAHVETKELNMRHQSQNGFHDICVGITEHQKGYLVYIPSTRRIIYSYDVVFDEIFSSALSYTSQPCSEAMTMRPAATYKNCATSLRKKTSDIITFAQFEEGSILTKTRNNAESGTESNDD